MSADLGPEGEREDAFDAVDGALEGLLPGEVSRDDVDARIEPRLRGVARQRAHVLSAREELGHQLAAHRARGSSHQDHESSGSEALGGLDRVIVNAGIGDGRRIGTGHFDGNLRTVETNFVAALAQCEAAVEIFRAQNHGHLVTISSMSAMRGLPRHLTSYAASKAALTSLTEGIRAELLRTPIAVSVIHPGYIRTELNETAPPMLFEIDERKGASLLVRAIEKEPASACVPAWPWVAMGAFMRWAPISVVARMV